MSDQANLVVTETKKDPPETVIRPLPAGDSGLLVGTQTIYELLQLSWERNAKRPCLGTRVKLPNSETAEYQWITYERVFQMASELASGLIKLGLQPGSMIGIYASNCVEWIVTLIAAQSVSIAIVPLYDIAGPKSIQPIISITKLSTVITSPSNIPTLAEAALSCHSIKNVIVTDLNGVDTSYLTKQGVQVFGFESVMSDGRAFPVGVNAPKLDATYMIMFTSGDPKGVVMTHRAIATSSASFSRVLALQASDVHVSYLPLVHIMEHMAVLQCLFSGASIGFWSGHIQTLWDDLKVLRPTILVGVPSVFNRMYDGIQSNLNKSSMLRRLFFSYAYSAKKKLIEQGRDTSWWDKLVFSKLNDPIGGRVRLFLSAAAPLTSKVASFLQMCFCCPVVQVYGMTETIGALTCTRLQSLIINPASIPPSPTSNSDALLKGEISPTPQSLSACVTTPNQADTKCFTHPRHLGSVGLPLDCNEIKLIPVPEADIVQENMGEVCVRGENVFKGYFAGPGKPLIREGYFDADGWFHTGDIASWDPKHKTLSIIDSKKNLFKLAQGEYIGTEALQSIYGGSIYVSQIAIVGRPTETYIVAIVVPARATILRWAQLNKVESSDFAELCRHPAVKRLIFEDLVKCANAQQLRGFQIVRNIHLEPQSWTAQNGFLHPSGKFNRNKIRHAYKDAIDLLYSQPKMDADPPGASARL